MMGSAERLHPNLAPTGLHDGLGAGVSNVGLIKFALKFTHCVASGRQSRTASMLPSLSSDLSCNRSP